MYFKIRKIILITAYILCGLLTVCSYIYYSSLYHNPTEVKYQMGNMFIFIIMPCAIILSIYFKIESWIWKRKINKCDRGNIEKEMLSEEGTNSINK